jgi:hypothetical protein
VHDEYPKRSGLLDGYVTEAELAAELDKDPRTLLRWRKLGIGPPFTMAGIKPMYNVERAREWLAAGGTASAKPRSRTPRRARRFGRTTGRPIAFSHGETSVTKRTREASTRQSGAEAPSDPTPDPAAAGDGGEPAQIMMTVRT